MDKKQYSQVQNKRGVLLNRGSGVEEGGAVGAEPPSCDLKGAQPPNSANLFGNKSV